MEPFYFDGDRRLKHQAVTLVPKSIRDSCLCYPSSEDRYLRYGTAKRLQLRGLVGPLGLPIPTLVGC